MNNLGRITIAAFALACPTLASGTESQQAAAERFVAMVKAGQDAKGSEFGDALSAGDAEKLKGLAVCESGDPRPSDSGASVMIMWQCPGQAANGGVGTMLSFSDGKLSSIFVMGAVFVTTKSQ